MTMTKDEVLAALRAREPDLRVKSVARAALFGSVARGEQDPESDIDILVELDPAARLGLWEYARIVDFIEDMFSTKVDVASRTSLKVHVRQSAERDAVYAF